MNSLHRISQFLVFWTCLLLVTSQENVTVDESENSSSWPVLLATAVHLSVSVGALLELINAPDPKLLSVPDPTLLNASHPILRRLPRDVIPLNYTVDLIPKYQSGSFSGHEVVLVKAVNPTKNIFLNVHEILIDKSSFSITEHLTGERVAWTSLEEEEQNQWLIITLATELHQDKLYELDIHFNGTFRTSSVQGILGHAYKGGDNRWIIMTHFESAGARTAFPCFDEPGFKAVFILNIATPPGKHTLSNMPLRDASEPVSGHPGWVWSRFEPSVVMSTYLVGFVISDLVCVKGDRNFSVWVQQGKEAHASLMLHYGPKLLAILEKFTEIPFVMPKLDNIAIPSISTMGSVRGTENWGLTTYTEEFVLFDEHKIHVSKKQTMVHLLAHELVHNWFGNLVTPDFWDELWLKEGFARYLQYLILGEVLPSWEMDNDFHIFITQRSLDKQDSAFLNRPIPSQENVRANYNFRSYNTGAVVIRMLEHVLTTDVFFAGLRRYLRTYAFRSATSNQLFEVLDAVAANSSSHGLPPGVRVGEVMRPWLFQPNHPVINVTRDYSSGSVTVCQADLIGEERRWWVPLSYTTQHEANFNNTVPRLWLSPNESCINLPESLSANEWIIVNIQQTGYYTVRYDRENWHLVMDYLGSDQYHKIHILNRAQLLADVMDLDEGADLSEEVIGWVSRYLARERSPVPWHVAVWDSRFTNVNESSMIEVMKSLYAMIDGLPMNILSRNTPQIWSEVLGQSCNKKMMPQCVEDAYRLLKLLQSNPANYSISPDLHNTIFCTALEHQDSSGEDIMFLWKVAQTIEDYSSLLSNLMWCSNSKDHLNGLIKAIAVDGDWLTSSERRYFIENICSRRASPKHVEEIGLKYLGIGLPPHLRLLKIITAAINNIPSYQRKFSQMWCEVSLDWLTRPPINIFIDY